MSYKICAECVIEKDLGQFLPQGRPVRDGLIPHSVDVCKSCRQGNVSRASAAKYYAKKKAAKRETKHQLHPSNSM